MKSSELEKTLGDNGIQGSLACCSPQKVTKSWTQLSIEQQQHERLSLFPMSISSDLK